MRDDLSKQLCAKYPYIFRTRHHEPATAGMTWGFGCGSGWYKLIDHLCSQLSYDVRLVDRRISWCNESDTETLQELQAERLVRLDELPVATQVKEKFGGLRFGVYEATETQYALIRFAESLSTTICEECGSMNAMTYHIGWNKTLCPQHADEKYGEKDAKEFRQKNV